MTRQLTKISSILLFLFSPFFLLAQDLPTSDEVQRVMDFYHNGKGDGVVLIESKICKDVHRQGNLKYECQNEIIEFGPIKDDGSPPEVFHKVKKGEAVYIWMAYLVPIDAAETVYVNYSSNGKRNRDSRMLKIKQSMRYRTWTKFTAPTPGKWDIKIMHKADIEPVLLGEFVLTVE